MIREKGRAKLERLHKGRVAALGCWVCGLRASVHHIRDSAETGTGLKASDFETIPLCPDHHQNGGYGVAYHAGSEIWEKTFGTQQEMLTAVMKTLERLYGRYWE